MPEKPAPPIKCNCGNDCRTYHNGSIRNNGSLKYVAYCNKCNAMFDFEACIKPYAKNTSN